MERPGPIWTVTAIPPVRYRAGRRFGAVPVMVAVADLTEAERAALIGDPLLRVEAVELAPAPEAEPAKPKPAPKPSKGKAEAKA